MIKLPDVIGLTLCDRMEIDVQSGQVSLVGVFHALWFRTFPSALPSFTVYVAMYDGVGEGTMELSVMHLESETIIHRFQRWFVFPGRGRLVNQEFPVRRCLFPTPGRYSLRLFFDGQLVSHRLLDIYQD